ncbi:hypothetical protein MPC4_250032 [Methylocella tundrae]|uniref:Uncharacterized protein n=1 Tax=Methylocella tundrae TaxID=227605 RepID=A0A8B6M911_METTU|nr:hypothetical protein MPC4_250032 [Methylocella tundrae]
MLQFYALGEGQRILDVDAEIANSALDLRVTEQDLDSPQVSRPP